MCANDDHADQFETVPADDERDVAADDALLDLLSAALRTADPVPEHVIAAARGAVAWRTIDEELADLVFDSATELTGVRDRDAARQPTFRAGDVEVEVMLVDSADRRLVGQLVPAQTTAVRLESVETSAEQRTDRYGRFAFDEVGSGPLRLNIAGAEGQPDVVTDWVLL